jgi:hypothetical protein
MDAESEGDSTVAGFFAAFGMRLRTAKHHELSGPWARGPRRAFQLLAIDELFGPPN